MYTRLKLSIAVLTLTFGFATAVSAAEPVKAEQQKSWEVDLYGGDADVTYVDDGYDDVHIYDHNNHNNDRSYIEEPSYGYRGGYRDNGYRGGHGYYDPRRVYVPRHYRPSRYRVEYHHDYGRGGYGYDHGYRSW